MEQEELRSKSRLQCLQSCHLDHMAHQTLCTASISHEKSTYAVMVSLTGEKYRHLGFKSKAITSIAKNYTSSEKHILVPGRNGVPGAEYQVTVRLELPIMSCVLSE